MNFKIETVLKSYIETKARPEHLTIKVIPTEFTEIDMSNDTTVTRFAQAHGFQMVYFGNLYETALGDSNMLEIKGGLTGGTRLFRTKKIKFKTLADSTFIKEMNDQANTSIYAYCEGRFKGKEIKKGIKILEGAKCYSDENYVALKGKLARFLYLDRNYRASLSIDRSILLKYPNSAFYFDRIARAYIELGKLDSAEIYGRKAYGTDSIQPAYAFNYAWVLAMRKKYDEARPILEKMIKKDSKDKNARELLEYINTASPGYFLLSKEMNAVYKQIDTLMERHDYKSALAACHKASQLNPDNITVTLKAAYCYLLTGDTATAYLYTDKVLKKDSISEDGLFLLSYMDGYSRKGASNALNSYSRAMKHFPKNLGLLNNYTNYLMRKKKYKLCKDVCIPALAIYGSDLELNTCMAYACLSLYDYANARDKFEWLNLFNPSDEQGF
jgi:tetratricopeptide (TPR) repeat protein